MDMVSYALLKGKIATMQGQIEGLAEGFHYKGSVATAEDLPSTADGGDMYTVTADGSQYVYDGTAWVLISAPTQPITNAQIDALF